MRPISDPINPLAVLLLDCIPDVGEFAVFEDEKVVFLGEGREGGGEGGVVGECGEGEGVNVGFGDADEGADLAEEGEDGGGRGLVERDAEVGAFARDEGQEGAA